MSVRRRREARRAQGRLDRSERMARLGDGASLRASPAWATVVQALAFVRKELAEILRQPRLLLLLVIGPFLLLLLFGAGYRDTQIALRTEFVGPEGSVYEDAVAGYADELDDYLDVQGFSTAVEPAVARLADGEIDAVVVFPADALGDILEGEQATIDVLHEKLDPFQQTAIDIASRLAVQEVNASVLGALAGGAQSALAPLDAVASTLAEQAAELTAAVAGDDADATTSAAGLAAGTLSEARIVMATSRHVVARLAGDDQVPADVDDMVSSLEEAEAQAVTLAVGGPDLAARATTLAATLEEIAALIPRVGTIDPGVLVQPFDVDTRSIAPVSIEPADYFAPSSIVLLLQHLALTFAALSLVRDRELGLLELLRVGPLSSVEILIGKTIAYLVIGIGVGAALLAAAVGLLAVPMEGDLGWIAATLVLVLVASLALGMVLSMVSGSETQAVQFSMLSLLAGMFFSGFILDIDQLAAPYRSLSYALPVTHGIAALRDVMLRGVAPDPFDLLALGGLVAVYGSLAVWLLHRRLRIA